MILDDEDGGGTFPEDLLPKDYLRSSPPISSPSAHPKVSPSTKTLKVMEENEGIAGCLISGAGGVTTEQQPPEASPRPSPALAGAPPPRTTTSSIATTTKRPCGLSPKQLQYATLAVLLQNQMLFAVMNGESKYELGMAVPRVAIQSVR